MNTLPATSPLASGPECTFCRSQALAVCPSCELLFCGRHGGLWLRKPCCTRCVGRTKIAFLIVGLFHGLLGLVLGLCWLLDFVEPDDATRRASGPAKTNTARGRQ